MGEGRMDCVTGILEQMHLKQARVVGNIDPMSVVGSCRASGQPGKEVGFAESWEEGVGLGNCCLWKMQTRLYPQHPQDWLGLH